MSSLKKITRRLAKLLRRVVSRPVLKKLPSPAWRFLRNRKGLVIGLGVILFLLPVVYFVSLRPRGAEAGWFNDQWLYRKPIAITNAGSDQTDFQINLSIGTSALVNAGKMQSDCDDIKITDVNGNLLPYWIEENNPGCNAATDTNIWVKASSLPTSGATLYIYYGNPSASSSQNGNDVFEFFDDFSGASLDTNKWTSLESPSISAGVLSLNSASTKEGIRGLVALETQNSILGFRTSISSVTLSIARNGFSNTTDLSSNFYADDDAYVWNGSGTNDEQYCSNNEGATNADAGNTEDTNYHVYELRWSSSNTKFYKDDNLEHTASVQFADETSYPRFEHQASGGALTNNVDWIYVRSYAATEPSAGTPGTEEESEGLVAYWAFDEGYGTTANDSTQNTYHATLGGTALPTWKNEDECVSGKCLYFNGYDTANNSKVTLAETSTTKTNILDDVTTSLWIKPTSNYYDTGEAVLRNGQGADLVYSVFYDPVNQRPYFHWYDGSFKAEYANSNTVPLNKWSHIAITRSGTTLKFYINGVLDTTATVTAPTVAASQLCIGQTNNDAVAQDYTGFIDEVKIYPYARTATQIKTDYASAGSAHGNAAVLGASKDQGDFLSEGLVGYWKMDANVGTTIPDYSGNGNTGTFGTGDSAPGWTSGMYGVGLSFDGSNDYVNVNNTILDNAITFSISAWVKTTDDGNYKRIVHKGAFGGASGNGFWFRKQSTNVAAFYGGCTATGTSSINDGAWHYITGVKTSSQSQIYVNGILQDACDDTTTLTTTNNLQISGYNNGVGEIWNGSIDEVRIYNRALSPKEVRDLYNWAPGPVGYWKMDEKAGTSAYDSSGNNNTGTLSGSSAPVWTTGKYGSALKFDGSNDYVEIADPGTNSVLDITNNFSLELWFKPASLSQSDKYIFAKDHNVAAILWEYTDNAVGFYSGAYTGDVPGNSANMTINNTNWHHIVYTYNGTNFKGYLDGILKVSSDNSFSLTPSNLHWYVGCADYDHPATCTASQIDDVRIYNYARTQKQIVSDMNAGHPAVGSPVASAVAHWDFNEGYGTTVNNTGNGGSTYNGTFGTGTSAPTWSNDGKFGKALSFSGTVGAVITAPSIPSITVSGTYSFSAWIKPTASGVIFQQPLTGSDRHGMVVTSGGGAISFGYYNGAAWTGASGTVTMNQWNHVVGTNANGTLKLYVNGILQTGTSVPYVATGNILYIGRRTLSYDDFDGLIDEVKIYSYALTEDEVKLDYNFGKAMVLGVNSTNTGSTAPSDSSSQTYCIPGDTSTCNPPVAEWNFEKKTGTSAYDTSGNGNTATFVGTPVWTTGKYGSTLNFDDTSDYLSTPGVVIGSNWTISTWAKFPLPNTGTWRTLLRQGGNHHHILASSGGEIGTYVLGWYSSEYDIDNLSTGWHHVTAIGTGGSTNFYIDGALVGTATAQETGNITQIGGVGSQRWGIADQIMVYDYARTAAQIAWDYNRGGPVGWWDMDECEGTTVHDASGLGNTGMITIGGSGSQTTAGSCGVGNTAAAWSNGASGKYNASLNFDGTDDYTSINNSPSLNITGSYTLSLWLKSTSSSNFNSGYIELLSKIENGNGYEILFSNTELRSYYGSGIYFTSGAKNWQQNTWYHVTATLDTTSQKGKIYINGSLIATEDETGSPNSSASNNLIIASWPTLGRYFTGQIDDVRIYNYALTATQVKQLYNQGSAVRFGE